VDANGEGYTQADEPPTPQEQAQLRSKFETFITSPQRAAWIAVQGTTLPQSGLVMCIFRDMEDFGPGTPGVDFYGSLPQLVAAGTFCEVFQLWVHADVRR
jgi:hypothetical protein